jgi:metal-responsive CopG/Arc/MetJ family transcriptional regulator
VNRKEAIWRTIDEYLMTASSRLKENKVQSGVFEVLFPSLSEVHVRDLTDAQECAVLRINVSMHQGMVHHALFSAKESVNSLCKYDILKIPRDSELKKGSLNVQIGHPP